MKIVLVNGPPHCGKDTVAYMLEEHFLTKVHLEKFAAPLKITAPVLYNISQHDWETKYDTMENKGTPFDVFFGKTPREVQIAISEALMKPLHGNDIFGRLLIRRCESDPIWLFNRDAIVISDSGFREEAEVVIDKYGTDNVQLWRLHRDGCDYSDDSRGYIDLADEGVTQFDIQNNGTLDELKDVSIELYKAFMEGKQDERH